MAPQSETRRTKGKQVASQASHHSSMTTSPQFSHSEVPPQSSQKPTESSTQFSEISQLPRQTPKNRKQRIPVSLSSRKIQKKNPNPKSSNPAFKNPATSSSVQSMLKQVQASYNLKATSAQPSSMPTPTSSSMPTTSTSDAVGTVATPKQQ